MRSPRRARRRSRGRFQLGASPPRRARRWPRPPWKRIGLSLLALALLGSVSYAVAWAVLGDALRVRDVTIVGVQVADPFAVAAAADVTGESLLTLDTAAVAERVEALAAVREARVQRDWPRGVIIDITEHQGWGYWQVGDVRRVIDADGQLVAHARPPSPARRRSSRSVARSRTGRSCRRIATACALSPACSPTARSTCCGYDRPASSSAATAD